MADLRSIFGGAFVPPVERHDPPEQQLIQAMRDAGIEEPPDQVWLDGKLRRFSPRGKGDKTAWYVGFGNGVPAARFGCWRAGIEQTWHAKMDREFTAAESMALTLRMEEAKKLRDAEKAKGQQTASEIAETIWVQAGIATAEHPYLARKGIETHGARVTGDGRLIVPLYSPSGALSTLQYIAADGEKRYHPGGATGGCFWSIGTFDRPGPVYLAEGFATAASIHEVTGRPCFVAYSAGNLVAVAGHLRGQYPEVVIVADNDESGVGQRYAEQASAKYGCRVVLIPQKGDANDYHQAGGNLLELLNPPVDHWLISADDFSQQPAPIKWLVKRWIQSEALIMIHGPSGGGKTFAALDMVMSMAGGLPDWFGHRVTAGPVVYLAGEGYQGLRGRIAGWKKKKAVKALRMWVSQSGTDLNTPEGYRRAVEAIRALPEAPSVVVVDTLHRFLHGDENSAQDAKTMLDACSALIAEFRCAVILVHHTGVSDEAQHRARGSSAWRGALDIEISVIPGKGDKPIEIVQRKAKDSEEAAPIFGQLESVAIDGWLDEDGEQVTTAVFMPADAPVEQKKEGKLAVLIKTLEQAFWCGGAENRDGKPYISRSAMREKLLEMGYSERTAENHMKPSETGKLIGALLNGGVIEPFEHGWVVLDLTLASALMMQSSC